MPFRALDLNGSQMLQTLGGHWPGMPVAVPTTDRRERPQSRLAA
jgi:hypothetical protein